MRGERWNCSLTETGGIAFFPKSLEQVDEVAAELRATSEASTRLAIAQRNGDRTGFRRVHVTAEAQGMSKLMVAPTGYFPTVRVAKKSATQKK